MYTALASKRVLRIIIWPYNIMFEYYFVWLQWNIADYFYQNRDKITVDLNREAGYEAGGENTSATPGTGGGTGTGDGTGSGTRPAHMPPFDQLWMCVYLRLGELCVDPRPAVRKSAGQTLFSTIAAHGSLLQKPTWQTVLWKVASLVITLLSKHKTFV